MPDLLANRALVTSASPLMVNLGWISDLIG